MATNTLEAIEGKKVSTECKVETVKDLFQTDIATTFAQHIADSSDYKPERLINAFTQLKEGKKISEKDASRLIESLQDPIIAATLNKFVTTHKDIFSSLLVGLDHNNNLSKNEHPLFDDNSKFVGYDRVIAYIQKNTEGEEPGKSESSETLSNGASEEMKVNMIERQKIMREENRLSDADREALEGLPLSIREEAGVKIIKLDGFGEFSFTAEAKTIYSDMDDKAGVRSIDNLKSSTKFRAFADTIKGCDMMSLDRTYQLMNILAKQLGITQQIDQNYLNTVFGKYPNMNLPLDNDLGRILRALYVITGDWFVIPILVDGKVVRSVDGNYDDAWIFDYSFDYLDVRPLSEIASSLSA